MTQRGLQMVLVVPATNTTMEPEIKAYCPELAAVHVVRVPPFREGTDPREERDHTLAAVRPHAAGGVDLVVYGCTAAGFLSGLAADEAMRLALADRCGAPAVTTAQAMVQSLRQARVARTEIVTPYLARTNAALKAFLEAAGIAVDRLETFNCKDAAAMGEITAAQVLDKALATATPGGEALFVACTQMPTIGVLPQLRERLQRPVCSSVKATAWMALAELARTEAFSG